MEKITVGVATIPGREKMLYDMVHSIVGQVDQINIYLNGHHEEPFKYEKIKYYSSKDYGDKGDAGKFFVIPDEGYYFPCDDDLIYPSTYIEDTINHIERFERQYVISYHGRSFGGRCNSYYRGATERYRCLDDVKSDVLVQFGGTGVMAFHADTIKKPVKLSMDDFPLDYKNMADINMGVACKRRNIGIMCVAHKKGYIRAIPGNGHNIHSMYVNRDRLQTIRANTIL